MQQTVENQIYIQGAIKIEKGRVGWVVQGKYSKALASVLGSALESHGEVWLELK